MFTVLSFCKNFSIYHLSKFSWGVKSPSNTRWRIVCQNVYVSPWFLSTLTAVLANRNGHFNAFLSISCSLARALDLQKHLETPARRLSAGEARKVHGSLSKSCSFFFNVVHRKPSFKLEDVLGSLTWCQWEQNMVLDVVNILLFCFTK